MDRAVVRHAGPWRKSGGLRKARVSAPPPVLSCAVRQMQSLTKARFMQTSSDSSVVALYDGTAESYARMMDEEIELPVYSDTLARLSEGIRTVPGAVVDTSCGSGHMLWLYRERHDPQRAVMGVDLSERMVALAQARLGPDTQVVAGDMRRLPHLATGSVAGVINFFSIHHLESDEVKSSLKECHRILRAGGRLVLAAWEGAGVIDYGGASDVIACKHGKLELMAWLDECGYRLERSRVDAVEDMGMDAVYLDAEKI